MEVYADVRCFQDPSLAYRGVGYHASTLLRSGRPFFPRDTRWIGLMDPKLGPVPSEYADLFDAMRPVWMPSPGDDKKLFVQLSPMTHSGLKTAGMFHHPRMLTAAVVYDFIPLDLHERYLQNPKAEREYIENLTWLGNYGLFFPLSQYSSNRLHELISIDAEDVYVTGVALRPEFEAMLHNHPQKPNNPNRKSNREYFLFVGGADRRKNIDVLLRAHASLSKKQPPDLVIVGKYTDGCRETIYRKYRSFGGNPARLRMMQGLSDSDLARYYTHCVASVCCSEIEGFSLPVIEAMACRSAIFASDIDAHRELVRSSELMFSPHDHERLACLLLRAMREPQWIQSAVDEHEIVAQRFQLERVGYRFWNPIAQRIRALDGSGFRVAKRRQRPRVAVISPFPPDRSGVADYTRRSLEEIGKLVDVDVYTDVPEPNATRGVQTFHRITSRPYITGEYDAVVSVVGNSHFHTKIIDLQVEHGGPCLIHDNRLAELYNWWRGPDEFRQMACKVLKRRVSYDEAQSWIQNPGKLPSMFFDEIIHTAFPLMVHSKGIQRHVHLQYGVDAAYLPFCVYRDFSPEQLTTSAKQAARQRLGISDTAVAVITLGIVSPTKAPRECIEAIATAREAGIPAELYFVGSASGMDAQIQDWARTYRVPDAIHLCGDWVDEQKYADFVIGADLAIQLRTHFFGGLSGAMLDCIASGLTTIANDDLAEALDSPASVLRISDALNSEDIAKQLIHASQSIDIQNRLTADRETYVREHSFEAYAQAFVTTLGLQGHEMRHGWNSAIRAVG